MANKKDCVLYVPDSTGAMSMLHPELTRLYGRNKGNYLMELYMKTLPEGYSYLVANEPTIDEFLARPEIVTALANNNQVYQQIQALDPTNETLSDTMTNMENLVSSVLNQTDPTLQYNTFQELTHYVKVINEVVEEMKQVGKSSSANKLNKLKNKILFPLKEYAASLKQTEENVAINLMSRINNNERLTQDDFRQMLTQIDNDANVFTRWMRNAAQSSNQVLQIVQQALQDAYSRASVNYSNNSDAVIKTFDAWIETRSDRSSTQAIYDPILEQDASGKYTGKIVREGNAEYAAAWDRLQELKRVDPDLYQREKDAFNRKFLDASGKMKFEFYSKKYAAIKTNPTLNSFYESMMKYRFDLESNLPTRYRQGYNLPQVIRGITEATTTSGVKAGLNRAWNGGKLTDAELAMEQNFISTTSGREIPVLYTQKVDPKELSYDVMNNMLGFYKSAERFKSLSQIESEIQAVRKTFGRGIVRKTTKFGDFKTVREGSQTGVQTNLYKMMSNLIDMHMYGKKFADADQADISLKIKKVKGWLDAYAFGNPITPVVTGTFAVVNTLSEQYAGFMGSIGSSYFNASDFLAADKDVLADSFNIISDMIHNKETSETAILMKYFGVEAAFNQDVLTAAKALNLVDGFKLLKAGTKWNEATTLLAILRGQKITNPSTGEIVSMKDALEVKNGKVVKKFDFPLDPATINRYHQNVANEFLYRKTSTTSAEYEQYAVGQLAGFFRSWFINMFDSRFAFTRDKEGNIKPYYSQALRKDKIGSYTAMYKLFKGVGADLLKLQGLTLQSNWRNLSQVEKTGVVKCGIELGIFAFSIMLTKVLASAFDLDLDDEDDRNSTLGLIVAIPGRSGQEILTLMHPATYIGGNGLFVNPLPLSRFIDRTRKNFLREVVEIDVENDYADFDIKEGDLFD